MLGYPIQIPREFFDVSDHDGPGANPNAFVCKFGHYIASLDFIPPSQVDKASNLDKNLFSPATTHVYVRVDSHRSPLQPLYQGPNIMLAKFSTYFKTRFAT